MPPCRLPRVFSLLACTAAVLYAALPPAASAPLGREPRVALAGSMAPVSLLRRAHPLGRVSADTKATAVLALPWRNSSALSALIARQSNPHDPLYKKWLSAAEFDRQFAPTQADYDAVLSWASRSGLTVAQTVPSRNLVVVSGKRNTLEAAFSTTLRSFRTEDGRTAMRPATAPRLPQSIASRVSGVLGLDTLVRRQPMLRRAAARPYLAFRPNIFAGNGPGEGLSPADIKTIYNLDNLGNGAGQTIALYELDGYIPSDITTYAIFYGLGVPTLQNVLLNGFSGLPTVGVFSSEPEVVLDIEMVLALAPKATIVVYEADNSTQGSLVILSRIASDNTAGAVSISYGIAETLVSTSERTTENYLFQRMVAQGQSVYVSSGDSGAYQLTGIDPITGAITSGLAVSDPASQPNVVAVGGTTLLGDSTPVTDTAGNILSYTVSYQGETTWNTDADDAGGGGISTVWPKPAYQAGVGASLADSTTGMRDVPDVSLNADPETGYSVYLTDYSVASISDLGVITDLPAPAFGVFGGTSASAPLWAAFHTLVNQTRATYNLGRLGFANPDIYAIAKGTQYGTTFHDIADGSTNLQYAATTGYDDATGWGSFIGSSLLASFSPTVTASQTLQGTVTNASGIPITDASVVVTTRQVPAYNSGSLTIGADGSFSIPLATLIQTSPTTTPVTLTYSVSVSAPGYAGQTVTGVTVPTTLNFVLRAPDHMYANPGTLQMISAPYDYSSSGDFLALFGLTANQIIPGGPNLIAYAPTLSRYALYPNTPADTIRPGQGYWARLGTNGTIQQSGTPTPMTQTFRINLQAGWNQIGDPFLSAVAIGNLQVDSTTASGSPVSILLSSDVVLPLYLYDGSAYQILNASTDSLQPWVGYWIYARKAVTLLVPPPAG